MKTFDFKSNNVQEMELDVLKQTYHEKNFDGKPSFNGIYHYELIERIGAIIAKNNINFNIESIFAANNKKAGRDGVSVSKELEAQYGDNSIQAHVLRRVFTTIRINDLEDDETNTGLAVAFHQDGIQIAIGPNVKICHNQCILAADRMISTYGGDGKIKDLDKVFQIIDDWMQNFTEQRSHDQKVIARMKAIEVSYNDTMALIGRLNTIRVVKDSSEKSLKKLEANVGRNYPLNQTQISTFVENYLLECIKRDSTTMSLWDIYNISTEFYKPGQTDFPSIIGQNIAWSEFLVKEYNL